MKIAVLGATGMLGSQVLSTLEEVQGLQITATYRDDHADRVATNGAARLVELDATHADIDHVADQIGDCDWWINCIGVIKPFIHDDQPEEVAQAIRVNSLFPATLTEAATRSRSRMIQISTDCVWDGVDGNYSETAPHNATDVYGKSKSLGEIQSDFTHTIRCSIIGREIGSQVSLLDWFLGQPQGASLNGFENHHWNGVTTIQFAKICQGIIEQNLPLTPLQHLVPSDQISKYDLLKLFAQHFGRSDLTISPFNTDTPINRTITTNDSIQNATLWLCGGYAAPPSIAESIIELAGVQTP
jgi:dTDP-4-dehydrorhamnose reductase